MSRRKRGLNEGSWGRLRTRGEALCVEAYHKFEVDVTEEPTAVVSMAFAYLMPRAKMEFRKGKIILVWTGGQHPDD